MWVPWPIGETRQPEKSNQVAFCVFPLLLNFLHKENIVYEANDYCEKHDRYPRDYRPY